MTRNVYNLAREIWADSFCGLNRRVFITSTEVRDCIRIRKETVVIYVKALC